MQKIIINGVKLIIISNTTRLKHPIKEEYLLPLGDDESGAKKFIYVLGLKTNDYLKIIDINPKDVNNDSPMEFWKPDDWCYFYCNQPLYRSDIITKVIGKIRTHLRMDGLSD